MKHILHSENKFRLLLITVILVIGTCQSLYEEPKPVMNGIETIYSDNTMTDITNPTYGANDGRKESEFIIIIIIEHTILFYILKTIAGING